MHTGLGLPAVVLSTTVGTAIFSTLTVDPTPELVVATGVVSLAAAVLTALQTFFGFAERAETHREAGAQYASLKRELDILKTSVEIADDAGADDLVKLSTLVEKLNSLEQRAPDVSDQLYDRARNEQEMDSEGV